MLKKIAMTNIRLNKLAIDISTWINDTWNYPDDASGVHREPYEFSFVEILRQVPRLDCIDGAHCNQEEIPTHGRHDPPRQRVAY